MKRIITIARELYDLMVSTRVGIEAATRRILFAVGCRGELA